MLTCELRSKHLSDINHTNGWDQARLKRTGCVLALIIEYYLSKMRMRYIAAALFSLLLTGLVGCSLLTPYPRGSTDSPPSLNDRILSEYRSGPGLSVHSGRVLTDNDDAFETKLELVKAATRTIDLAYYIFSDDYSSSLLARELLAATRRGVRIRMLLDYHSHYQSLDYFRMLEQFGNTGNGSLSVRFYNRPSRNIVKDAVYMTLGCGQDAMHSREGCSSDKFQEIEALFANEFINGENGPDKNISNLNTGNSGLFLSGLYAKNPELMSTAVVRGQDVDIAGLKSGAGESNPEDAAKLKELAKLYWLANYGSGLDRLVNRVKLSAAFLFYGDQVDPIYDTFSAFLPVERSTSGTLSDDTVQQAREDWRYLTDFLHHKILFVDQQELVTGGRNVEDSYHMNPNRLSAKYTFMDTDVHLRLKDPQIALTVGFEKLWQFDTMVATLQDVALHAPNDFLVNSATAKLACESLADAGQSIHQNCLDAALLKQQAVPDSTRYQQQFDQMNLRADHFVDEYTAAARENRSRQFVLDTSAQASYVENLPFDKSLPLAETRRFQGARNDHESDSGKNIHALWLSALKRSCEAAAPSSPVTIYLHNAYFFLPSNLLSAIAQMVDGRQPCADVDIIVLTNSIETTDLNVVNLLSRHSLKALFEHYASRHDPSRGASLSYHEYLPQEGTGDRSLHSKVMVFGDDIFIGSANADLRSYMMDSNNGLFIRQAPELVAEYTGWLRNILDDNSRSAKQNDYYIGTDRSQILQTGDDLVDAELEKYRADRFIKDPQQILELKARLRHAANEVYRLSRRIIADHGASVKEQALFNELFKTI